MTPQEFEASAVEALETAWNAEGNPIEALRGLARLEHEPWMELAGLDTVGEPAGLIEYNKTADILATYFCTLYRCPEGRYYKAPYVAVFGRVGNTRIFYVHPKGAA